MRWGLALLLLVSLSACNYGTQTFLKDPQSGKIVICGPYPHRDTAAMDEQNCLKTAESQGYVRLPQR